MLKPGHSSPVASNLTYPLYTAFPSLSLLCTLYLFSELAGCIPAAGWGMDQGSKLACNSGADLALLLQHSPVAIMSTQCLCCCGAGLEPCSVLQAVAGIGVSLFRARVKAGRGMGQVEGGGLWGRRWWVGTWGCGEQNWVDQKWGGSSRQASLTYQREPHLLPPQPPLPYYCSLPAVLCSPSTTSPITDPIIIPPPPSAVLGGWIEENIYGESVINL